MLYEITILTNVIALCC